MHCSASIRWGNGKFLMPLVGDSNMQPWIPLASSGLTYANADDTTTGSPPVEDVYPS
jgi:hypothetical protein